MRTVEQIIKRKRKGIDCDQDESCKILGYFDYLDDVQGGPQKPDLIDLFPLEWDQWCREREEGYR